MISRLDSIFFQLIQVAIGNRSSLSVVPSCADEWAALTSSSSFAPHQSSNTDLALDSVWRQLRLEFKKQALLGIGYVGVTKLPAGQTPPIQILAQWVHNAEKIRKKNERITGECVSLCEQLAHDGLWACILKGQGNLINYPEGLRDYRTPGDIDVWCAPIDRIEIAEGGKDRAEYVSYRGERAVIEYALMQARLATSTGSAQAPKDVPEVRYHHVELADPSHSTGSGQAGSGQVPVDVEIHHRPSFMCSPWRNRRLRDWCREQQGVCAVRYAPFAGEGDKNPFDKAQDRLQNPLDESDTSCTSAYSASECSNSDLARQPQNNPTGSVGTSDSSKVDKPSAIASKTVSSIPIPTNSFNAIYQLVHIYRHLFDEGIGLRQLLDYYFVLRSLHIEQGSMGDHTESMGMWAESIGRSVSSNTEIMHTLGRFGMKKFAGAVMWVLARVFDPRVSEGFPSTGSGRAPVSKVQVGTNENPDQNPTENLTENKVGDYFGGRIGDAQNPTKNPTDGFDKLTTRNLGENLEWKKRWPWMLCPPNEKEGKWLLNEIMLAGNFGQHDERIKHGGGQLSHAWEKTKHNMRLLTHYPEEVMWEPVFRIYHWLWRRFEWWK